MGRKTRHEREIREPTQADGHAVLTNLLWLVPSSDGSKALCRTVVAVLLSLPGDSCRRSTPQKRRPAFSETELRLDLKPPQPCPRRGWALQRDSCVPVPPHRPGRGFIGGSRGAFCEPLSRDQRTPEEDSGGAVSAGRPLRERAPGAPWGE